MNIEIRKSERSDKQFCLTYFPEPTKWDEEYISLSGYCGIYGPHVFASAPELLEALETITKDGGFISLRSIEKTKELIAKAKGQTQ